MEFHFFVSSFCRVGQGAKTNKRQNEISKFHFFVCSFCHVVQVAKRRNGISFLRFFVLSPSPYQDRTTKRQSYREISKFDLAWLLIRFVVCSFCRLPQGTKTTERQNEALWPFRFVVCSFYRVIQVAKTKKWTFILAFVRFVRQNEQTKRPYPASIVSRMSTFHILCIFFFNI